MQFCFESEKPWKRQVYPRLMWKESNWKITKLDESGSCNNDRNQCVCGVCQTTHSALLHNAETLDSEDFPSLFVQQFTAYKGLSFHAPTAATQFTGPSLPINCECLFCFCSLQGLLAHQGTCPLRCWERRHMANLWTSGPVVSCRGAHSFMHNMHMVLPQWLHTKTQKIDEE